MSSSEQVSDGREQRFHAALADCLERLENKQGFSLSELKRRYPEFATELQEFLGARQDIERLLLSTDVFPRNQAPVKKDGTKFDTSPESPQLSRRLELSEPALGPPLGDYRIIREVGRGGMGIVYEARQLSLDRRVALKVLPTAATLDSKQLQRFKNEAHAAAQLHHPNIVPVYGVGCERSIHYYAMQFIDGRTLAALIAELPSQAAGRDPTESFGPKALKAPAQVEPPTERLPKGREHFRLVAELGRQAAQALEHAHQLGIVHRDIKPANLLIDRRGCLWITDFGLAYCQGQETVTQTGDLIGTLRYMSPEQALGQRATIDHRTDIYSLGVTLYEFLTLEPAIPGSDRQEILGQIAFEEPRSPRRINRSIPSDLETIVLKAIAKVPAERYATAGEMADDLGRFLRDEPIRARRPTVVQLVQKWARRHRGPVVTAAVASILLLALAAVGLAISNRFITAEKSNKETALKEAITNLNVADENFQKACDAVDRMLTRVAEERLRYEPGTVKLRRLLFEDARDYYLGFLQERGSDPRVRREAARAHIRLGNIYSLLGEPAQNLETLEKAIPIFEELAAQYPDHPEYRSELLDCHLARSSALGAMEHRKEAELACLTCLEMAETLAAEFPNQPAYQIKAVIGLVSLAQINACIGRNQNAIDSSTQALAKAEKLAADFPAEPEVKLLRARCRHILARSLWSGGRAADAEEPERQALEYFRKHAAQTGNDPEQQSSVAICLVDLSEILIAQGKTNEAEAYLQEAFVTEQKLNAAFPGIHQYLSILEVSSRRLNDLLVSSGRSREAEQAYRHLLEIYEKMAADFPGEISYRLNLATFSQNLANLLFSMDGRMRDGEAALRRAVDIQKDLVAKNPASAACRARLFRGLAHVASYHREQREFKKAAENYFGAVSLLDDAPPDFPGSLLAAVEISNTFCDYAIVLKNQGRLLEARALLNRARTTGVFDFAARNALNRDVMYIRGRYPIACAAVSVECGPGVDEKESAHLRQQALDYLRADLAFWSKELHSRRSSERIEALRRIAGWAIDPNLAGVRREALAELSVSEREAWQSFWRDVKNLLVGSAFRVLIPQRAASP